MLQEWDRDWVVLETFLDAGDYFWATGCAYFGDGLFRVDKNTLQAEYKGSPAVEERATFKYSKILGYKGKLYLIPRKSDYLGIYDITNETWKSYLIEKPHNSSIGVIYKQTNKFSQAFIKGDVIYIFPMSYPAILKFNVVSEKIEYLYDCMDILKGEIYMPNRNFCPKVFSDGRYIYFYCKIANAFMCFDMEICQLEIKEKFGGDIFYEIMECDLEKQKCWFLPESSDHSIMELNMNTYEKTAFKSDIQMIYFKKSYFLYSILVDEELWLLPGLADNTVKINLKTGQIELVQDFSIEIDKELLEKRYKYVFCEKKGNNIHAFDGYSWQYLVYDIEKKKSKRKHIKLLENQRTEYELLWLKQEILHKQISQKNMEKNIGKRIFQVTACEK